VFVDPKARQFARYAGAEVITPNLAELALATGVAADDLPALEAAGAAMIHDHDIGAIVLTQGPDGMTLIDPAGAAHSSQAHAQEVFDVTGAGDTVIASVAAARCAGLDWRDTLYLANNAAGLVVGRVGAVPIDGTVLLDQLERHSATNGLPIYSFASVAELVKQWRAEGDSIVFTNGCFDLLHIGHVACLEFAKRQGDRLVVAVNTDKQVAALKGARRPVQPLRDRVGIVAGMRAVDAVFAFDGCTPIKHILELQPDVLVKAADYTEAEVVGREAVDEWGGRVALVPVFEGRSTSAIIKRIKS
jgi:D-beta-D-heptose 7-phosphate kinase/D-beta-D-heptose 1-phosphate adenosyltransferase